MNGERAKRKTHIVVGERQGEEQFQEQFRVNERNLLKAKLRICHRLTIEFMCILQVNCLAIAATQSAYI